MVRVMVQLEETQLAALRSEASRRGVSLAALVREAVDRTVGAPRAQRIAKARAALGRFDDRRGATDVARNHDRYLFDP